MDLRLIELIQDFQLQEVLTESKSLTGRASRPSLLADSMSLTGRASRPGLLADSKSLTGRASLPSLLAETQQGEANDDDTAR